MLKKEKIIVIGAGLSGPLLAILLAKRGYAVAMYERRPDMRLNQVSAGRSINLALSNRGILPLKKIGMDDVVLKEAVAMHGRMIHDVNGNTNMQPYSGRQGEYIYSVSRGGLNMRLMDEAERNNIPIYFNHRCTHADLDSGEVTFLEETTGKEIRDKADIIIGTDGAGSAVRGAMLKQSSRFRFNFSQEYLEHGYKELRIPPGTAEKLFRIEKHALHIWPRGGFMLIALPNFDGSFTVTLFHYYKGEFGFDALNSAEKIMQFFTEEFPDSIPHMPELIKDFMENPTGVLSTVKCYPWQANHKFLLLGDAAHAIVPFYGQGMNCSFEDCLILDTVLEKHSGDWGKTMENYQKQRKPDTDAIADLAIENFYEMRDHVANVTFVKKRKLEMKLEQTYPDYYSKYALVTFREDLPYAVAKQRGTKQNEILLELCSTVDDVDALNLEEVYEKVRTVAAEG